MNSKLILIGLISFFISSTIDAQEWEKISSEKGKFSISFPGKVKSEPSSNDASDGYQFQTTYKENIYMASVVVHKTSLTGEGLNSIVLAETSLDAFVDVMKGDVSEKKEFSIDKNKGIEAVVKNENEGFIVYYKVIIIGQHQYQIILMSSASKDDPKTRKKYFKSFSINK